MPGMVKAKASGGGSKDKPKKRPRTREQVACVTLRDGTEKWRSWLPLGRSGKRKWTPLFESKLEALECRKEMLRIEGELPPEETMTFGGAVAVTQKRIDDTKREGTSRWFKDHSAGLLRELGKNRSLVSIRARDIESMVQKALADGLSPTTIRHRRAALSRVFAICRRHMLGKNPLREVDRTLWPEVRPAERYSFTAAEVTAITTAMRRSGLPEAACDADYVALMFLSGLRRAELCRLTTRNVDLARRQLWVDGKRGNESMPIGAEAAEVLERLVAGVADGEPLVPGGVAHMAYVCDRANKWLAKDKRFKHMIVQQKRKLTPHALRHSFCTALSDAGVHVDVARRLMRHKNLAVTMRYFHSKDTALTGALDTLSLKRNGKAKRAAEA